MANLTKGELEVLQVLWDGGPMKPTEVQAQFARPIKNAALRSVLRVLMEKGEVKRTKRGVAYYYEPTTPKVSALKSLSRRMATVFSSGSTVDLIAQMIKAEKLSKEDVAALARFAADDSDDGPAKSEAGGDA